MVFLSFIFIKFLKSNPFPEFCVPESGQQSHLHLTDALEFYRPWVCSVLIFSTQGIHPALIVSVTTRWTYSTLFIVFCGSTGTRHISLARLYAALTRIQNKISIFFFLKLFLKMISFAGVGTGGKRKDLWLQSIAPWAKGFRPDNPLSKHFSANLSSFLRKTHLLCFTRSSWNAPY